MKVVFRFVNDPGFGDNIRGLITVLQIQKTLKFDLEVDFSHHIFANYFIHDSKEDFKQCNFFTYNTKSNLNDINMLTSFLKNETNIIISTNIRPMEEIDEDTKTFLKKVLELKPEINEYLEKKISMLPENYHLFHYRLGDDVLVNKEEVNTDVYFKNFEKNAKENAVVISDSLVFKQRVYDFYQNKDVFVFLNTPTHTNREENIDTLVDFFLVAHAKSINCYSNYFWISNFVFWTSIVYDIPLFNLKE